MKKVKNLVVILALFVCLGITLLALNNNETAYANVQSEPLSYGTMPNDSEDYSEIGIFDGALDEEEMPAESEAAFVQTTVTALNKN